MSSSRLRRILGLSVAAAATATMLLGTLPAGATSISHPSDVITAGGSDTTEVLMGQILSSGNKEYNVLAEPATAQHVPGDSHCNNTGTSGSPGADAGVSYAKAGVADGTNVLLAPKGSGAGRNALRDAETHKLFSNLTTFGTGGATLLASDNACYDIGRSSGDPRAISTSADTANFEYYAFALDAVVPATTSNQAPASSRCSRSATSSRA